METAFLECKRTEAKIKAHTEALKKLREAYKAQRLTLYESMKAKKKTEYKGYTLEALAPKPKVNTKAIRQQKEENIKTLLATSGVGNPTGVLAQIQDIQRPKKPKATGKK